MAVTGERAGGTIIDLYKGSGGYEERRLSLRML